MFRNAKSTAVAALFCALTGSALTACDEASEADAPAPVSAAGDTAGEPISGTTKITVAGRSVNVSCSGTPVDGTPVVVLMAGLGDGLDKMAGLQQTLSEKGRACSYDRLGEGASDQPGGVQTFDSSGAILTGVLDRVAGDEPVVLAGHSLGGLIAARYAPGHQDRVAGLVLMDATPSTILADTTAAIPESATGPAAELRAQSLAVYGGQNPEQLTIEDGEVGYAGDIPVEVIQHGQHYLAEIPEYGDALERAWAEGQDKWLDLSSRSEPSTASASGHYIYVDQPDVAVQAIQRVTAAAAE
ncbi:alpha/beta hydrolase [Amycolatopsis endophytica]|uniref:Pimeloyl-ACP methyl ester carboxylesterase n=1 Tax=Amycolatopsis endophytica TaxID=860233 RepID=A0A853B2N3_9PSEU|nr:alpha/beta fold hydrolase [Amycolatopsis endophytica]NYI89393.1 pimeloyl-ACP methyl ester carboxylesterase [Amycolatopsis endophytica]